MCELSSFSIDDSHIEKILKNWAREGKALTRTTEIRYVNYFKAMIWLEERAQAYFLKQFKKSDIHLIKPESCDPKVVNIFRLKNDVSLHPTKSLNLIRK